MLFTQPPKLKHYLFPFGQLNNLFKGIVFIFLIIFMVDNSGLEYWIFKQHYHFSDCSYWKNKSDNEIVHYFQDKDDYVKTRAINAFYDCHIKQATPFIVSTFSIPIMPPDRLNYMEMRLDVPWTFQEQINNYLLDLWRLPKDHEIGEEHQFQSQKTILFWKQYYANHKNDK